MSDSLDEQIAALADADDVTESELRDLCATAQEHGTQQAKEQLQQAYVREEQNRLQHIHTLLVDNQPLAALQFIGNTLDEIDETLDDE